MSNEQEAMKSPKGPICLFILCLSLLGHAPEAFPAESTLHALRGGMHDPHSRVVLDLEGPKPVHVGIEPETEVLTIRFAGGVRTSVKPESLASRLPRDIARASFEGGDDGFVIRIVLKIKNTREKHFFLSEKGDRYRLVIDLYPDAGHPEPLEAAEKAPPPLPAPDFSPKKKEKQTARDRKKGEPAAPPTQQVALPQPDGVPAVPSPSDELYRVGHSLFESYQSSLQEHAGQIIDQYKGALKAAPGSPEAPLGLFRLGLAYLSVADYKRGEECFRKILASYPRHPLTPLCWMHLGRAHEQRKAPLEAVQALRTALTLPLEKADLIETYVALSRALSQMGAHAEVLETIKTCLELDPSAYVARPELLRLAGEAHFATHQYDKATAELLWYINLGGTVADRDMLLAKLAESLLYQKEPVLAKRVYAYIERHHPETEGNVISKIRRAEHLEKQEGSAKEAARFIYQELVDKGLTGPLSEYVLFKLATWEREHANYARSLELIDRALGGMLSPTSKQEFSTLRTQVALECLRQAVGNRDHPQVIALYNANAALVRNADQSDLLESVGDSCLALKLYPNALDIYKQAQAHGRKEDVLMLKIARSQYLMGDLDGAAQQLQPIRSDSLGNQKALLLGQIAHAKQQYKEAIPHFARALTQESDLERADLDTVLAYAESLARAGKPAEAVDLLTRATAYCPAASDPHKQVQVGLLQSRCFLGMKQPEKAIATLEHLVSLSAQEPLRDQLNYQLSELYLENKQPEKAKAKLAELTASSQSLWKAAAQQQLDYLEMHAKGQVKTN